jgi:NAD+ kinase
MKIALYYRHIDTDAEPSLRQLTEQLHRRGIETCELRDGADPAGCDFLFSIGGDGTLLSSIQFIGSDDPGRFPPVLGINFGHLGFLTTVGKENLESLVDELLEGRYTIEERTLLQLSVAPAPRGGDAPERPRALSHCLNEVFVHRTEEASLLKTEVYVNGDYVATYAGDGVIVATPTGSTAYSLSCGGPILTPDSRCLLITPISAHTLTLRPIILPDTAKIRLHVDDDCFLGTDSRRPSLAGGSDLLLAKTPFTIRLVRLGQQNFFTAIREKLMWGTEVRS